MTLDLSKLYGCYRCGAVNGGIDWSDDSCVACGEHGIVTVQQAFDMLNDLYVQGKLKDTSRYSEYLEELQEYLDNG